MFKLFIKRRFFLLKFSILFMSVMTGLSLFESWRSGDGAARAYFTDPLDKEYERQVLEDEARVVPGLGEGGRPATLAGDAGRRGEESFKKNAMNVFLSDRIPYSRRLADVRYPACADVIYDAELPSASVVIIFHNEPYSVVLRTVWSVLNTARRDQPWHEKANYGEPEASRTTKIGYPGQEPDSEFVYLKEIILVDDNSTLPELRGKLSHYVRTRLPRGLVRLLRLPERGGLTRARQAGARAARGDVLVFLDGHCEGLADWIRPLLQRIKDKRTAVVIPVIDMIEAKTFGYITQDTSIYVGGFSFAGFYTWTEVPESEWERRKSEISHFRSPSMAGGLFAASRSYYWQLGGYDEQMAGWGAENLEMSFRVWQCGGALEMVPCSRVGHVFRSFAPYGLDEDTQGVNMARVAEVWMDEYAELFYLHRPDLRKNPIVGDVSGRRALREQLGCRSFQWYLEHVYSQKFVPVRDAVLYGRVQNPSTELCLDTMRRKDQDSAPLGIHPCRATLTDTQHLSLSPTGQLRDEEKCAVLGRRAERDGEPPPVLMARCDPRDRMQQWEYLFTSHQLRHVEFELCIDAGADAAGEVRARACANHSSQRWTFDYGGSDATSGLLSPDVEERLRQLRAARPRSGPGSGALCRGLGQC